MLHDLKYGKMMPLNATSDVRTRERRYSVTVLIYSIYLTPLLTASLNVQENYSTELYILIRNHVNVIPLQVRGAQRVPGICIFILIS